MPLAAVTALKLGAQTDVARVLRLAGKHGTAVADDPLATDRVILDTFDGRLKAKGLALWMDSRPARDGSRRLVLDRPGEPGTPVPAVVPRADRILAGELPLLLRDRLAAIIEERALLPRARVRSRLHPVRVLDADAKTVVRLTVEEPHVIGPGGPDRPLGRWLHVRAVRGYDRDFERVTEILAAKGRLGPAGAGVVEEALRAAAPPGPPDATVTLDRRMPAVEAMLGICRRQAQVVDANLAGTVADLDPEFLHDLRVAVRRTRSVLKEMRGVLDPAEAERSRADLRWIQEITGPTRDLDVLLLGWAEMIGPVPESMAPDLEPLHHLLESHRADAFDTMRRTLKGRRYAAAWKTWKGVVESPPVTTGPHAKAPIGPMAAKRIIAVYRGMDRMGSAIDDSSPATDLHDLRKKGKELRYLLEMFGGMWPQETVKPLVSALKGLQDVLGHFQDDEIQVHELRGLGPELAAAPGGTDSLIALGFVVEGLSANQRRARADFAAHFADFTKPETRALVETTFTS